MSQQKKEYSISRGPSKFDMISLFEKSKDQKRLSFTFFLCNCKVNGELLYDPTKRPPHITINDAVLLKVERDVPPEFEPGFSVVDLDGCVYIIKIDSAELLAAVGAQNPDAPTHFEFTYETLQRRGVMKMPIE